MREIAQATLPEENIDREYVVNMVLERRQRMEKKMEQRQNPSGMDMVFSDSWRINLKLRHGWHEHCVTGYDGEYY